MTDKKQALEIFRAGWLAHAQSPGGESFRDAFDAWWIDDPIPEAPELPDVRVDLHSHIQSIGRGMRLPPPPVAKEPAPKDEKWIKP